MHLCCVSAESITRTLGGGTRERENIWEGGLLMALWRQESRLANNGNVEWQQKEPLMDLFLFGGIADTGQDRQDFVGGLPPPLIHLDRESFVSSEFQGTTGARFERWQSYTFALEPSVVNSSVCKVCVREKSLCMFKQTNKLQMEMGCTIFCRNWISAVCCFGICISRP